MELIDAIRSGDVFMIIAQLFGFLALAASVTSFQMKTYKQIMIVQIICATLFVINYAMLYMHGYPSAISGGISNFVCIIRNIVFWMTMNQKKYAWVKTVVFSAILVLILAIFYAGWPTLICMAGMVLNTVSFSMKEPQKVRKVILFSAPLQFIYNLASASVGGAMNEAISFTSAVIGLLRYRKKS